MIKKTLLAVMMLLVLAGVVSAKDKLAENFSKPPASARPWVYWFPLSGNLTKEGITADLEAMARVGIGGALYMEVEQGAPKGPADFAGPLWRELFQHACAEADRLGLEINMNNDAGWCGSGGPWMTPELSMQKVTWSDTFVTGGQKFDGLLARPNAVRDFYRDTAVLAFPTIAGDEVKMEEASPKWSSSGTSSKPGFFTLPRPDANAPQFLQIEFPAPFTARILTMGIGNRCAVNGELQVSDDGQNYKSVQSFSTRPHELLLNFEAVTGRFYRLMFNKIDGTTENEIVVAGVDLNPRYRIDKIQEKVFFKEGSKSATAPASWPTVPAEVLIPQDRIIDLTSKMDVSGKLTWDVPEGMWTILRIGYTTTGAMNSPAPESGRGLECDKMSKEAARVMFDGLMGKLIADNKAVAGKGKTLVSTHVDSWEVGQQNWTPRMREEFLKRRGYDMTKFLPVFTGRIVENNEITERFMLDLRQTVSDLIIENYAGEMTRLANQNGLRFTSETYMMAPYDEMTCAGHVDEPMAEFWAWPKLSAAWSVSEITSAAHTYGKQIVGAEAFTSVDSEKWQGHPGNIKDIGDWAFCEGINRFVIHRFAAQPWTNVAPGMSMGPWGLHYERTQTWWEQSKAWHEYLTRCQYLLQQGTFVADVAYLQAEGAPRRFSVPAGAEIGRNIRGGYNYDGCTPEVVLTRMSVKKGRIVLPDNMSYRVLVLPEVETMSLALLKKIKQLADDGATVIGGKMPPQKALSLAEMGAGDTEVKKLAAELWASGKIITGKTAAEVLGERGVKPDFISTPVLRYTHRTIGDADVYFVANPEQRVVEAVASFRVAGKKPEFWRPDTGEIMNALAYEEREGVTSVPLRLEPSGSVFVIFRKATGGSGGIVSVVRDETELLNSAGKLKPADVSVMDIARGEIWQSGNYVFKSADGKKSEVTVTLPAEQEIDGSWDVQFNPAVGGPAKPVKFEELEDWSKRPEDGIKFYSGTASYRKVFDFAPEVRSQKSGVRIHLDLGAVEVMAEVRLNGKGLGTLWKAPFVVDVTDAIKPGANELEIKVVNLWINRQIGDEQLLEDSERNADGSLKAWPQWLLDGKTSPAGRVSFTSWRLWKKDDPLVKSGLLGPVTLRTVEWIMIDDSSKRSSQ